MELKENIYVPLVRIHAVKESQIPYGNEILSKPEHVVAFAKRLFEHADREYVLAVTVNSKNKPQAVEVVAIGSLSEAIINPREVYKNVILSNGYGVILLHNHPSGSAEASMEDWLVTRRLKKAAGILGIAFLDHIIVGEESFFSMASSDNWNKDKSDSWQS